MPRSPFFGEEYRFRVPRDFQRLTFYVCEPGLRCDSRLGKVAIPHKQLLASPLMEEAWHSIRPIDADSEVQVSLSSLLAARAAASVCVCVRWVHVAAVWLISFCECIEYCLYSTRWVTCYQLVSF